MDAYERKYAARERLTKLAVKAGFETYSPNSIDPDEILSPESIVTDYIERFAALVAEECAKIADEHEEGPSAGPAIRARFKASV